MHKTPLIYDNFIITINKYNSTTCIHPSYNNMTYHHDQSTKILHPHLSPIKYDRRARRAIHYMIRYKKGFITKHFIAHNVPRNVRCRDGSERIVSGRVGTNTGRKRRKNINWGRVQGEVLHSFQFF